jgi:hypothetical protein
MSTPVREHGNVPDDGDDDVRAPEQTSERAVDPSTATTTQAATSGTKRCREEADEECEEADGAAMRTRARLDPSACTLSDPLLHYWNDRVRQLTGLYDWALDRITQQEEFAKSTKCSSGAQYTSRLRMIEDLNHLMTETTDGMKEVVRRISK